MVRINCMSCKFMERRPMYGRRHCMRHIYVCHADEEIPVRIDPKYIHEIDQCPDYESKKEHSCEECCHLIMPICVCSAPQDIPVALHRSVVRLENTCPDFEQKAPFCLE